MSREVTQKFIIVVVMLLMPSIRKMPLNFKPWVSAVTIAHIRMHKLNTYAVGRIWRENDGIF